MGQNNSTTNDCIDVSLRSAAQRDSIDSVHLYIYTGLQPSGTVPVIPISCILKNRLNSLRAELNSIVEVN